MARRDVAQGQAQKQTPVAGFPGPPAGSLQARDEPPVGLEPIRRNGASAEKEGVVLEAAEEVDRLPGQVPPQAKQGLLQALLLKKRVNPGWVGIFSRENASAAASPNRRLR